MDCTELQHAVLQVKNWDVHVRYTPSFAGLHLLIDSTGMKCLGEGECKTKKHGAERRCQWRKVHLGIDESNRTDTGYCGHQQQYWRFTSRARAAQADPRR